MTERVLVIEDNPANLELMVFLLRAFGFDVHAASDGEAGLRAAARVEPALIVCDLQLPDLDGYEVVRRLKADPALLAIPVVAVTAYAMVDDRRKAIAAGFDDYIAKPIEPERFAAQIRGLIERGTRAGPGPEG